MAKIDYKKEWRHLYNPSKKAFQFIDVPEMQFFMVDGRGDPNSSEDFQQAIEALYGLSYTLKFAVKQADPQRDYAVMPLEGLWWSDETSDFLVGNKEKWQWTLMIMQPEFITPELVGRAVVQVREKRHPAALEKVRFEKYREGHAVHIMYVGPYADEAPVIREMHAFLDANGYEVNGRHHEIYLSDPRRTAPERLKTVLRQPVKKTSV